MKNPTILGFPKYLLGIIMILTAGICSLTSQTVQIDFGADTTGTGWNAIDHAMMDGTPIDLIDIDGAASGLVLTTTTPWNGENKSGFADGTGAFIADATVDSIFGNDAEFMGAIAPNPMLEISGLNPDIAYSFTIFASRMGASDNRTALYTATGSNTVSGELNAADNTSETLTLSGIIPTSAGVVVLDFTKAAANDNSLGFIYLGALIINDGIVTLDDYPTPFSPDPERHRAEIDGFLANDAVKMPSEGAIVATGSSSMRGWSSIHSDLDGLTIIARGFGGSFYSDVIYYADEIILPYNPRAVLIYEGDNDAQGGKSPETILGDLQFLVDYCRTTLPELRFYVISAKPSISRWSIWPDMMAANTLIETYCNDTDGMTYIDGGTVLLKQDGTPRDDIYGSDGLHFISAGYDAWASVIAPIMLENELEFEEATEPVEFDETALYIDFGTETEEAGWNSYDMEYALGGSLTLVDGTGATTGVSITTLERFNGINGSGSAAGLDAFIGDATTDSVFGNDQDWSGNIAPNPTFQFDGLNPDSTYNLTIFASRMGVSDVRSALYTAVGSNEVAGELDASSNEVATVTLSGVIPDANGSFVFDFKKADSNDNGYGFIYLGGMIIEEVQDAAVQIDFGGDATAEGWNLVTRDDSVGTLVNLSNSSGTDTGMVLRAISPWNSVNNNGSGEVFDGFVTEATSDSLFGNDAEFGGATNPNPAIEITGMKVGTSYTFTIFASRMGASDNRTALYTVTGDNVVSGELDSVNNANTTLVLEGIVPNSDGTIVLDWQRAAANNNSTGFIYLGAMIIEGKFVGATDPEPAVLPWEEAIAGDFIVSPWFGAFEVSTDGWVNHSELIWLYVGGVEDSSSMWIYSTFLDAWVWSTEGTFPMVFNSATGSWTYFFQIPEMGVWEYDMSVGTWVFHQ